MVYKCQKQTKHYKLAFRFYALFCLLHHFSLFYCQPQDTLLHKQRIYQLDKAAFYISLIEM